MRTLVLLSIFAVAFANKCGENSHFESCGTACPLTCDNYDNPPKFCVLRCDIGCQCDKGYVRTSDNRCVKPEECPSRADENRECGENEIYLECGTACPRTCENFNKPIEVCPAVCVQGCQCRRGYVKNQEGKCVKPRECGVRCGKNERYNECGTSCPLSCQNYTNPEPCDKRCNPGCECKKEYVRSDDGRCIKPKYCGKEDQICGKNERYNECGTACPLTCENLADPPQVCTEQCVIGCECKKGYVRNQDGKCVKPRDCPTEGQICGKNERYNECGTACPLTCENLADPPQVCTEQCVIGCECKKGYVRNQDGKCVKPKDCPAEGQVCGKNERYNACGTACPLTCENLADPPQVCTYQCVIGCECKKGYVRNQDGKCVKPRDCPTEAPTQKTCLAKPDSGLCDAYFPMWYYDVTTESCYQFVYGGCGGNGNRYETEEECLNHCKDVKLRSTYPKDCDAPVKSGVCMAYFKKYYYDKESEECKQFIYGGCGGNGNNFETKEECEETCLA